MELPSLAEILPSLRVVALPMRVKFRGVMVREAALLEGPQGWTEFSPFPEYEDHEAANWLAGSLDYGWNETPTPQRDRIGVNATVPAVTATEVPAVLALYDAPRTVKVKVAEHGQMLQDDIDRVRAVRDVVGPDARIRIDANAGWTVEEAERALNVLAAFDLEYAEQPTRTVPDLAEIRRRVRPLGVKIAADESIRKASDPIAVARAQAADLIVIKAQPLGGIQRALKIVEQAGLDAVVSSALDTSIGISMGVALAASLPSLSYDCGLGTTALFTDDVTDAYGAHAATLPVGRLTPSRQALDRLAVRPDRTVWWRERIIRCHTVLTERPLVTAFPSK